MILRKEERRDIEAITQVTVAAFENHPISRQTEQFIIDALRSEGALTISLVANVEDQVVGHIAFSPVVISGDAPDWYGLGPVSVLPAYQQRGIGKKLISEGLALLKKRDAKGCVLVGSPEYYTKFGFSHYSQLIHEGIPQEFFLVLPFDEKVPKGTVVFHEAFAAEGE